MQKLPDCLAQASQCGAKITSPELWPLASRDRVGEAHVLVPAVSLPV